MPEPCGRTFDEALLSGYVDRALVQRDGQRVRLHLERCAECRAVVEDLIATREVTMTSTFEAPRDDEWPETPRTESSRLLVGLGWPLVTAWAVLLAGYALWGNLAGNGGPRRAAPAAGRGDRIRAAVLRGGARPVEDREDRPLSGGAQVIVVTANRVAGKRVARTLGLVRGNTIRTRHLGKDIMAVLRNIVGGEVSEYTKLLAESREQALDRMVDEAHELGANAVISLRFSTSMIMGAAAELLAYGTAVVVEDE